MHACPGQDLSDQALQQLAGAVASGLHTARAACTSDLASAASARATLTAARDMTGSRRDYHGPARAVLEGRALDEFRAALDSEDYETAAWIVARGYGGGFADEACTITSVDAFTITWNNPGP